MVDEARAESPKWVVGCTDQEKQMSSRNSEEVKLAKFGDLLHGGGGENGVSIAVWFLA